VKGSAGGDAAGSRYPVTRIWSDSAGVTHFEDGEISLADGGEIGMLSEPMGVDRAIFRSTGADYDYDWHPTPARQLILMMSGEIEIETGIQTDGPVPYRPLPPRS